MTTVAKDYTDYITMIWGGGQRVYGLEHVRQLKNDRPVFVVKHNGHRYDLQKDRAFLVHWTPWRKWIWGRPFRSLHELVRTKKVGLIPYQEPPGAPNDKVKIEPMHISRMHQPSGELLPPGTRLEVDAENPELRHTITPRALKALVDSPQFRRAYRSFKFGELTTKVTSRWWVIIAVVAIVITLFVLFGTGIVDVRGR